MNKLRNIRKSMKVTQTELSAITRIPYSCICNYEKGRQIPSVKNALLIAKALEHSVEDLFDE